MTGTTVWLLIALGLPPGTRPQLHVSTTVISEAGSTERECLDRIRERIKNGDAPPQMFCVPASTLVAR